MDDPVTNIVMIEVSGGNVEFTRVPPGIWPVKVDWDDPANGACALCGEPFLDEGDEEEMHNACRARYERILGEILTEKSDAPVRE